MEKNSLTKNGREAVRFILETLRLNLPDCFSYHNTVHVRSVIDMAGKMAKKEGVDQQSLELLLVAAAWHDCGYLNGIFHHEKESCNIARKQLPSFGFSKIQVDEICNIIMATKIPQKPRNLLQKLICDADLYYLGTNDYEYLASQLYNELRHFRLIDTQEKWLENQISFLSNHLFFTESARNLFDAKKSFNLQKLIKSKNVSASRFNQKDLG